MLAENGAGVGAYIAAKPGTLDTFLRVALTLDLGDAILGAIPTAQIRPRARLTYPFQGHARSQKIMADAMTTRMTDANVILWGRRIGWDETRSLGSSSTTRILSALALRLRL